MHHTWTFQIEITIPARKKEKAQEKLAKIVNKKSVVDYRVISLKNDFNGGQYCCPEILEEKDGVEGDQNNEK